MERIEQRYGSPEKLQWLGAHVADDLLVVIPTIVSSLIKANEITRLDEALKGDYRKIRIQEKAVEGVVGATISRSNGGEVS